MRWEIFRPGQVPHDSGLCIVEVLHQSYRMVDTVYAVRMTCCGARSKFSHAKIRSRQRNNRTSCQACRKVGVPKAALNAYKRLVLNDGHDAWVSPPSALREGGWWIWADRGGA